MAEQTIQNALDAHLNTNAGISVAWDNEDFAPTTGTPYCIPALLPARTVQADLGSSGRNRHTGIYQVTLVYPKGESRVGVHTKATALMAAFKRGTQLTSGGVTVVLEPPFMGPAFHEGDWYRVPISVPYFAYIDNP